MRYITVKDGKVEQQVCSPELPEGAFIVDDRFTGYKGDDIRKFDFDNGGQLRPFDVLVTEGLIEDQRGIWYRCGSGEPFKVTDNSEGLPATEEFTRLAPTSRFDEWVNGAWVTNQTIKTIVEQEEAEEQAQNKVISRLADTTDMILTFLADKFTLDEGEETFIDGMSSMADVKTAFKSLLSMTPAQVKIVNDFHQDYQAWKDIKGGV